MEYRERERGKTMESEIKKDNSKLVVTILSVQFEETQAQKKQH
jgi:hypothetical protein